ncbi:hypothetical protein J3R82DRAFT_7941 [Butyriboletus roseoflavus]|nr:hypothetical protein J3R82DRAFT_7941 [Butyriboletus roseoflavus]
MSWSPPSGLMHTRPWRSSPLAGPGFSTLPPIISESSEESHERDFHTQESTHQFGQTKQSLSSSSIVSDSLAPSTSGYGSRNASGSASALMLADGEASTSSISLYPSSSIHGSSSNSQHSHRPARLIKSPGRRPSSAQGSLGETSLTPPPLARTVSHGHSRSVSLPFHPVSPSPTIPQTYSRISPRPTSPKSEPNPSKPPPSTSRDPASNWMSLSPLGTSPFGPAMTPKFSRLAMASPAVVMPLSAREYRMRKARDSLGKGNEKEPPTSSNHVTFTDNTLSALPTPNGVPLVKISPPPPSSSGDHIPDARTQPQPQVDHPLPRPLLHASISTQPQPQPQSQSHPSSPRYKRSRSRPITPPRSSPLAAHPPISPKSSTGTFFSLASSSSSSSDDDATPPSYPHGTDNPNAANTFPSARLRPRSRSRSYPDRLSNGARLSLLEAMNHLSQESTSPHRLSTYSQTDGANRLLNGVPSERSHAVL